MCWSCGAEPNWGLLEQDHGDPRSITTTTLKGAADAAGISIDEVVANINRAHSHFDPDYVGLQKAIHEGDDALAEIQKALGADFEFLGSIAATVDCDVFKTTGELQYTLGVAYAANRADPHRGADGHRDFVSAEVLRNGAWSYMAKGATVGLDHKQWTDGAGIVVESYIWPDNAPDWPQENGYVVKSGDWLLGVVWNDAGWGSIREGKRRGFSIQGGADRRAPSTEALAGLREN